MTPRQLLVALVTAGLVVSSLSGVAIAAGSSPDDRASQTSIDMQVDADAEAQVDASTATQTNETGTSASTGQQLATVLEVTDGEVRSEVEQSAFETAVETDNETAKAAAIADRAATLRDRADAIAAEQRAARQAYESGDLSDTEYAQRLAVLNARATTVLGAFANLDDHAQEVSALELEAAGYNRSANAEARQTLRSVTGSGAAALLRQYTGEADGEFSVDIDDGVEIEVESEDGERSREFEREQPGNGSLVVNQSDALETARGALTDTTEGDWTLRSASIDRDDGYYEFEFTLRTANETGEAEVSVDGETGEIFAFEEEIEPRDRDDDDEDERDDDERESDDEEELSISIVEGTAESGATVTLRVTQAGEPVEGATVDVGDETVGETDADGRLTVTLPEGEEADIDVERGDAEGELEFDFGDREDDDSTDDIRRNLSVTGDVNNGTVSVAVSYAGDGVEGVTVYADGEQVGTTGANGTLTFDTDASDDLEVTLVKGAFEAELEFEIVDGTLELVESDVDVDDDKEEDDDREDDDREDDEDDDDREEDDDEEDDDDEAEDEDDDDDETDD